MVTGLFLCFALSLTTPQATVPQTAPPTSAQTPQQPAPDRLNGIWDLNKDQSTKPMAAPGGRGDDPGGRPGGGGPPGGGGMPGGGPPGGMGGGRGGGMRGGGGPDGPGGNSDDMKKLRAVMQEIGQAPVRLMIASHDGIVSITDPEGVVRRFAVTGKMEKVAINGSTIEITSAWAGESLSQEFKVGSNRFVRTIDTTPDGRQLLVTMTPKGNNATGTAAVQRFVYDRGNLMR